MWKQFIRKIVCRLLPLFFIICFANRLQAQQHDTLKIYKKIKKAAYKHKLTKLMYQGIFVEQAPRRYDEKPLSKAQKRRDPNARFAGRVIRNIRVEVLDPFGFSANDTNQRSITKLQNAANTLHITTRTRIVLNRLMFEQYDSVDMLKVTESERLLREAGYVNDARIYISAVSGSRDSADVLVVVHDKWNVDASGSISATGGYLRLRDKNMAGLGQVFEQRVGYHFISGYDFRSTYNISNIRNTYISSDLSYVSSADMKQAGVSLSRPFYSALTRWAGGIDAFKTWGRYRYTDTVEPINKSVALNYTNSDIWVARSYSPLPKTRKDYKNTNIIMALRYAETAYQKRPSPAIDTNSLVINTRLYLGSIGYSVRRYYKDQFIYRFGANEDIPEGMLIQLVHGLLRRELQGTVLYSGLQASYGTHVRNIGYGSAYANYGIYYKGGRQNSAVLNVGGQYFSDLLLKRRWYLRQFFTCRFVKGYNKPVYERVMFSASELYGMNPGFLNGTAKIIVNMETVAYAPYNLIGFRFAPVMLVGFGMLSSEDGSFRRSHLYQAYSLGVLVRNENLLNSSFEFTVGMYPVLPDGRRGVVRINPIGTLTLKLRSFTSSKPETAPYF